MDIGRTEGVQGPGRIEGTGVERIHAPQIQPAPPAADRVELTETGRLVAEAIALPEVRLDRIEEVRRLVESGSYASDVRLLGALDGFLAEMRGEGS